MDNEEKVLAVEEDVAPAATAERRDSQSPRWPPAVALLNLNGLGLGYLYLKLWPRWLIHLLITVALLALACWTGGTALAPALWWLILGLWLLWMAFDGWRQAQQRVQAALAGVSGRAWLPLALAVLLLVVEGAVFGGYFSLGRREFNAGMAAYRDADCRTAMQHFERVTTNYNQLVLGSQVVTADDRIVECSPLVLAENARREGEYDDAIAGYRTYLHHYPQSSLFSFVQDSTAATYAEWATRLQDAQDYPAAIEKHLIITTDYADTPAGREALALAAAIYAQWATQLWEAGEYGPAIAKYLIILDEYADTPTGRQAAAPAAAIYGEWAAHLHEQGQYGEAIARYQTVLNEYPDTPTGQQAAALAAQVYATWATQLRQAEEYATAIAKQQIILQEYPDTPAGAEAAQAAAEIYAEWASQLHEAGEYQDAIARYQTVLQEYPHTPTGAEAPQAAAETYADWGLKLWEAGQYERAVAKYQALLSEHPDTAAGTEAPETVAQIYTEWATQLRQAGEYEKAEGNYQTLLDEYPDTPAGAQAPEAVAETYAEWAIQLREIGEYETAIAKYQIVLDEYPATSTGAEVPAVVAGTYAEWAIQLRETDQYEAAVAKYQIIKDEYPDTPAGAEALEATAVTLAEWAVFYRQEGFYVAAIEKYETILGEYADTEPASTAQVAIGQTYNDWGQHLRSQRKYTQALEEFTRAQEATDDPDVIAAAAQGYDEALWELSQDRSGEGKRLMDQTLENACEGQPAPSPAIGLAQDEPGKALFGGSAFELPQDMRATKPAHFHYVVCLEADTSVVQRCPYTGGHTLVRQRRWWRVRVRDTRTGRVVSDRTFYGAYPAACPFSRAFFSTVDYTTGSAPDSDQVITWLQSVVR